MCKVKKAPTIEVGAKATLYANAPIGKVSVAYNEPSINEKER